MLAEARAGNKDALGEVISIFQLRLRRRAQVRFEQALSSKVGLSDLIQRTLIRATQSFKDFQGKSKEQLFAWLRRILDHEMTNYQREYHGQKRDIDLEIPLSAALLERKMERSFPPTSVDPAEWLIRMEEVRGLTRAIAHLDPQDRDCVRFRFGRHMSFEEIGRRLGCTAEAARKR